MATTVIAIITHHCSTHSQSVHQVCLTVTLASDLGNKMRAWSHSGRRYLILVRMFWSQTYIQSGRGAMVIVFEELTSSIPSPLSIILLFLKKQREQSKDVTGRKRWLLNSFFFFLRFKCILFPLPRYSQYSSLVPVFKYKEKHLWTATAVKIGDPDSFQCNQSVF